MDDRPIDTTIEGEGITLGDIVGWILAGIVGVLGLLVGGCVGWFYGAEEKTLIGAGIGLFAGFLLGFTVCGPLKQILTNIAAAAKPPDLRRWTMFKIPKEMEIHMTVHCTRNVINTEGILAYFGKKNDSFIVVKCGKKVEDKFYITGNPPKRTCVNNNDIYEETFNFIVQPTDDTFIVELYNQDIIGDELIGEAEINITEEILDGAFPQQRGYKLLISAGFFSTQKKKTGTVILSFSPGENFEQAACMTMKEKNPISYKKYTDTTKKLTEETQKNYGETAYGSMLTSGTLFSTMQAPSVQPPAIHGGTGSAPNLNNEV